MITNIVSTKLLKPNPKNEEYFDQIGAEKYEEIKRSIRTNGIRDPLKVLPDFTVIAGHQRLRIALELGLDKVPVIVVDVTSEEAEYLLIADNTERRQQNDDPVKKAKRAKFLKRYWQLRDGKANPKGTQVPREGQNDLHGKGKTLTDIAEAIGENESTIKRLLKLNDLILPLQNLISEGKLGQTAAHSLAFLSPAEQENLLKTLGESGVCGLSVSEAKELRRVIEAANREKTELANKLKAAEEKRDNLSSRIAELESAVSGKQEYQKKHKAMQERLEAAKRERAAARAEVEELKKRLKQEPQVIEKTVYEPDPAVVSNLHAAEEELKSAKKQLAAKERELNSTKECSQVEQEELKKTIADLRQKQGDLQQKLKKAQKDADKHYETLKNHLEANEELKGNVITRKIKLRSSITMAARVIGEAIGRVKIDKRINCVTHREPC